MTLGAICELAHQYYHGSRGFQQDIMRRQWNYMLDQQISVRICHLGDIYHEGGDLKKAKVHLEARGYGRV